MTERKGAANGDCIENRSTLTSCYIILYYIIIVVKKNIFLHIWHSLIQKRFNQNPQGGVTKRRKERRRVPIEGMDQREEGNENQGRDEEGDTNLFFSQFLIKSNVCQVRRCERVRANIKTRASETRVCECVQCQSPSVCQRMSLKPQAAPTSSPRNPSLQLAANSKHART